jgi:hypothetical protein
VPEAFLEEFPAAMYAAEIRHRKSVSLGRHVVCRANLQPLSEHQLAGLATMARQQLVALCMLQTAELHMVPYFGEWPAWLMRDHEKAPAYALLLQLPLL